MPRGKKKPKELTDSDAMKLLDESRQDKATIEPEAPQPEPTQEPGPHAAAVAASRQGFRPVPAGFRNLDSYPAAGLKVNRSLDKNIVAIQFAEDKVPSREEKDRMEMAGIRYSEHRRQWERENSEQPGANAIDIKGLAENLADERLGRGR